MEQKNKLIYIGIAILVIVLIGAYGLIMKEKDNLPKKVLIETSEGNIELELYADKSPATVENFLKYVNSGFYDGLVFHRVIDGFMIQGGGFLPNGQEKATSAPIKLESNNGLKNLNGTIAMARTSDPNSATSQFFINAADNSFLDYVARNEGYAVFGKVTQGMDVVMKLSKVQTTVKNRMEDWPAEDVIISRISII